MHHSSSCRSSDTQWSVSRDIISLSLVVLYKYTLCYGNSRYIAGIKTSKFICKLTTKNLLFHIFYHCLQHRLKNESRIQTTVVIVYLTNIYSINNFTSCN